MPTKTTTAAQDRAAISVRYAEAIRADRVDRDYSRALTLLLAIQRDMALKPNSYTGAQWDAVAEGIREMRGNILAAEEEEQQRLSPTRPPPSPTRAPTTPTPTPSPQERLALVTRRTAVVPVPSNPFTPPMWPWFVSGGIILVLISGGIWLFLRGRRT